MTNIQKQMIMKFHKHESNPKKLAMYYAILASEGVKFETTNKGIVKFMGEVKAKLDVYKDTSKVIQMVTPKGDTRGYDVEECKKHLSTFDTSLGITGELLFQARFPEEGEV